MKISQKTELHFLGRSYSPNNIRVETIDSNTFACFRGRTYMLKRAIYSHNPQLDIRKYRGVLYSKASYL